MFAPKYLKIEGRLGKLRFAKMAGKMDIQDFLEKMTPYFGQSSSITANKYTTVSVLGVLMWFHEVESMLPVL